MKEETFDDSYYEDFNEDWNSDDEEFDNYTFDADEINDNLEWMEKIEDPDLLDDFDIDDMEDDYDLDD